MCRFAAVRTVPAAGDLPFPATPGRLDTSTAGDSFTGAIEVVGGVPQFRGISLLHDLEHFEPDIAQGLDLRIPQHGIGFELGPDLCGRQFRSGPAPSCCSRLPAARTGAGLSAGTRPQRSSRRRCESSPSPVRLRHSFDRAALGHLDLHGVEDVVDAGSSMSRISSLTDTTGFMSPHRTGAAAVAGAAAGEAGFGDEQAVSIAPTQNNPATYPFRFLPVFFMPPTTQIDSAVTTAANSTNARAGTDVARNR